MFTLLAIQPILIPQEFEGQIGSYPGYFKAGREIQPPLSTNDLLRLQLEWHRLTDSSIPPKGQVYKFNKEALKKALIEAVTKLNNEEIDFPKVKVKDSSEIFNLEQDSGSKEDEED